MAGNEGSQWFELSAMVDKSGHLGINNERIWIQWLGCEPGTAVYTLLSAGILTGPYCVEESSYLLAKLENNQLMAYIVHLVTA